MTSLAVTTRRLPLAVDKLGVLIAAIAAIASFLPFAAFRANRIVLGEAKSILATLPAGEAALLVLVLAAGIVVALLKTPTIWRLGASLAVLALLFVAIGHAGTFLTPPGDKIARVSPGAGFWLLIFAFAKTCTHPKGIKE